jgi:hypothetical protein
LGRKRELFYEFLKDFLDLSDDKKDDYILIFKDIISEKQLSDFIFELNSLSDVSSKKNIIKYIRKALTEKSFQDIIKYTYEINDDPNNLRKEKRERTLERVRRYTSVAKKLDKLDPRQTRYFPPIEKYQVIKVIMSGLGSELDEDHFVIVWDEHPARDHITVIPTNSYKDFKQHSGKQFNIGTITNLPPFDTIVMLDQTTSISRKRLKQVKFPDYKGSVIKIDDNQKKRISEGFRVMWMEEKTLEEIIIDSFLFPKLTSDNQYAHLHRPCKIYEITDTILTYQLYNDENKYEVILYQHTLDEPIYTKLIKNWSRAVAKYDDDDNLLQSREDSIKDGYGEIKKYHI